MCKPLPHSGRTRTCGGQHEGYICHVVTTATVGACGQFCFSCGPNGPCLAKNWLNCELRAERGRSAVFLECAETDAHDFLRGWNAGDGWRVQEEMVCVGCWPTDKSGCLVWQAILSTGSPQVPVGDHVITNGRTCASAGRDGPFLCGMRTVRAFWNNLHF